MSGMATLANTAKYFKGRHFNHDIILLCVRWYVTYKLSYRDLVDMMELREFELAHQFRKEKQKRASRKEGQDASNNQWLELFAA